jgi:hypothetical protein
MRLRRTHFAIIALIIIFIFIGLGYANVFPR